MGEGNGIRIRAVSITAAAFAPFGDVITAARPERTDHSAALANRRPAAGVNLSTVTLQPSVAPVMVDKMERHLHSSQTFLPLRASRYLIIVAPHGPDGGPDGARLAAFTVPAGIGITYRADVWHAGLMVLDAPASIAILMWRDFTAGDEEFRPLPSPVTVEV